MSSRRQELLGASLSHKFPGYGLYTGKVESVGQQGICVVRWMDATSSRWAASKIERLLQKQSEQSPAGAAKKTKREEPASAAPPPPPTTREETSAAKKRTKPAEKTSAKKKKTKREESSLAAKKKTKREESPLAVEETTKPAETKAAETKNPVVSKKETTTTRKSASLPVEEEAEAQKGTFLMRPSSPSSSLSSLSKDHLDPELLSGRAVPAPRWPVREDLVLKSDGLYLPSKTSDFIGAWNVIGCFVLPSSDAFVFEPPGTLIVDEACRGTLQTPMVQGSFKVEARKNQNILKFALQADGPKLGDHPSGLYDKRLGQAGDLKSNIYMGRLGAGLLARRLDSQSHLQTGDMVLYQSNKHTANKGDMVYFARNKLSKPPFPAKTFIDPDPVVVVPHNTTEVKKTQQSDDLPVLEEGEKHNKKQRT